MRARGLAGAALPAVAAVMCATLAVSACTSAEPRRSPDLLSAAIAAQLDSYTVDKQIVRSSSRSTAIVDSSTTSRLRHTSLDRFSR